VGRSPSPLREGSGEGVMPNPRKIFKFGSQNGDFRCILGTIFTVHAGAEGWGVGRVFLIFGLEIAYYGAL